MHTETAMAAPTQTRIHMDDDGIVDIPKKSNGMRRAEDVLGFPAAHKMWSTVLEITPATAVELLQAMAPQRPFSAKKAQDFAKLISDGKFLLTHQGIAINRDGYLVDGQHRLSAIASVGEPVEMMVTFGVRPDAFKAMDRGRPRSTADDLVVMGIAPTGSQAKTLRAAANILWHYDAGRVPWTPETPSTDDVIALIDSHPHLDHAVRFALDAPRKIAPAAPLAAFFAVMREKDEKAADRFVYKLVTGDEISKTEPVYVLREKCIRRNELQPAHWRREFMVLFVRGWNATRDGRRVASLQGVIRDDHSFPRVK